MTDSTRGTTLRADGPILVGIDDSEHCARAFDIALTLARLTGAPLRLVAAYEIPFHDGGGGQRIDDLFRKQLKATARTTLDGYVAQADAEGLPVTGEVQEGHPAALLVEESKKARIAVVGKRGRNRFAGRFLGSVSNALASHSACPTLVIPAAWDEDGTETLFAPRQDLPGGEAAATEPAQLLASWDGAAEGAEESNSYRNVDESLNFDGRVVAAIDLGDSAKPVLQHAAALAHQVGRPLTLVAAVPVTVGSRFPFPGEGALELQTVHDYRAQHLTWAADTVRASHPDLDVSWRLFDGSAAGVLSEATRTASALVLGTRGHGGFAGLLLGSVSQAVLSRTVSPVLVVPTHPA